MYPSHVSRSKLLVFSPLLQPLVYYTHLATSRVLFPVFDTRLALENADKRVCCRFITCITTIARWTRGQLPLRSFPCKENKRNHKSVEAAPFAAVAQGDGKRLHAARAPLTKIKNISSRDEYWTIAGTCVDFLAALWPRRKDKQSLTTWISMITI